MSKFLFIWPSSEQQIPDFREGLGTMVHKPVYNNVTKQFHGFICLEPRRLENFQDLNHLVKQFDLRDKPSSHLSNDTLIKEWMKDGSPTQSTTIF